MARYQERFCYGIRRESSFAAPKREKTDRIPITLQREKTVNPERSVYTIQRDQSVRGERINLSFPRERVLQVTQQRKPVKFQKICGWNTPLHGEGIVEWIKIQLQIQGKKDRKLKLTTEDLAFRHVPKRRCPGLHDPHEFENDSLHRNFFEPEKKKKEQTQTNKQKLSDRKESSECNKDENSIQESDVDLTRRLLRSRSKDDMGVVLSKTKGENVTGNTFKKRCKSQNSSQDNTWNSPGGFSQLKRLLKCAKLYQSSENNICDDEDDDEGYGSKSSSADDKLLRDRTIYQDAGFGEWEVPSLDIDNDFLYRSSISPRKLAKFSYTHQTTPRPPLYGDSEDEGVKDMYTDRTIDSKEAIKYYGTGYQDNTKDYIAKVLQKTYGNVNVSTDISDMMRIRELRSCKLTVGKISIQDAKDANSQFTDEQSVGTNASKDLYDHRKTLVRSNSSIQTDRTQYPVYCTSPELKFNTQRPVSKKVPRSIREEHNQRLAQTELLNRTRFPYLDFYRAHSSMNLPLSDLLPAVDRSLKTRNGRKNNMYESVPNISPVRESTQLDMKKTTEQNPTTLGGPAFKTETSKAPEAPTRQPTYMLEYYQNPTLWLKTKTSKLTDENRNGVRLSGNPDKDSKKKLREAFSKFYNTRSSMKNRDWAKDYKYMWNT